MVNWSSVIRSNFRVLLCKKILLQVFAFLLFSNCYTRNELTVSEGVLADIRKRSVAIAQVDSTSASGSGILIAPNLVVTCNHVVIALASDILVKRDRKSGEMRVGKAVFLEPGIDLALIEVDPPFPDVPKLKSSVDLNVGQRIFTVASPFGLEESLLYGSISSLETKGKDTAFPLFSFIQVQNIAYPGVSGGGVYDMSGRVIGVNRSAHGFSAGTGIGFVIPWNLVQEFLELPHNPVKNIN